MATTKKMTKRDYYKGILAKYALTDAEKAFIEHELELLDRKSASGDKKQTAQQKVNETLKTEILANMEANRLYTISEMIKEFECCADLSTPKVSAMVRQLKDEGKVERTEDKRKAYFSKVVD